MSVLSQLREKYITIPVAKRITDSLVTKSDTPNIFAVPTSFNNSMGANNRRQVQGTVDYSTLRSISTRHETTRGAINTRKRQITQFEYDVVDISPDVDSESTKSERQKAKDIITNIGGDGLRFRELLDMFIEDTLVLDALVFYKQRTRGGQLLRVIPVDGATIKLRVGQGGETPIPPEVAYEQWIFGKKTAELTTRDLTYEKMNARTNSPYGLSPLETLILVIESSMRAAIYNANYLSDNNIPQGFLGVPEGWTVQQIKEYKEFFDAMISGSKEQSKVFPIPSGMSYQPTSKPSDFSFKEFFDYLDHKVAMLFDIQPQELGLNLQQYKENAEGQEKIQLRRGIRPLANFLEEIFTDLLRYELGFPNFKFKFEGLDGKYSLDDIKSLVPQAVLSVDEARNDMGLPKIGVGNIFIQGNTITPAEQLILNEDGTIPLIEEKKALQQAQADNMAARQQFNADSKKDVDENDQQEGKEKMNKSKGSPMDNVEKKKKFREFKRAVQVALENSIKPFTKEAKIESLNKLEKVSIDDLPDNLGFDLDVEGYLKWAAEQGGQNAYTNLGISATFELTNPSFQKMLGDRQAYLIDSVNETTKNWIVGKIADGKANALTNREIAKQIEDEMLDITSERANTIVNTEVANAMQLSELDTYAEQGIEKKQWVTSEDSQVDEDCADLDGEIVKVDEEFSSGDDAPPLHPNCRCYIQAIIPDDFVTR